MHFKATKLIILLLTGLMFTLLLVPMFRSQSANSRLLLEKVDCITAVCLTNAKSQSECKEISPVIAYISLYESTAHKDTSVRVDIKVTDKACN